MSLLTPACFPRPVVRDALAADRRSRGYSCGLFVDPPRRVWRDFVHDVDEVLTVIEGRLAVTIARERYEAELGDEVFIPAGTPCTRSRTSPSRRRAGFTVTPKPGIMVTY